MATQAADVRGPPESSRALRKPYVVRKSREKWNSDEHERFVEAVERYEEDVLVHQALMGTDG